MFLKFEVFVFLVVVVSLVASDESISGRIVGGYNAELGQFPFQASVQRYGGHICGGSIISEKFVLTSAHCVVLKNFTSPCPPSIFQVRVGSIRHYSKGTVAKVKRIIVHPDYRQSENDIALLELVNPLQFTKYINKAVLESSEPLGPSVSIAGWGRLYTYGSVPKKLQFVQLTLMSKQQCDRTLQENTEALVCLSHPLGTGTCFGDSGGPAVSNGKLIGVASFVMGGCGSKYPDGYMKIPFFYDWIVKNANLSK